MDGVLADVYAQLFRYETEELGIKRTVADVEGKLELDAFRNGRKYVMSKGFFRTAPVMKGSVEGLKMLNEKYKVLIVSSATEFPYSLEDKLFWLNEHFPFITWQQMIFCGKKDSIKGDIMLDNHPKNLDYFDGETILFSQPHNVNVENRKHKRVNDWKEVISILG